MKRLATIAFAALVAVGAHAAEPAKVYRCGQTYQQSPCPQGKAVEVDDARSEAQRGDALAVTRDQARLGRSLERERVAREKALQPAAAVGIGDRPAAAASAPKKPPKRRPKHAAPGGAKEDFVAIEPRRPKPRADTH